MRFVFIFLSFLFLASCNENSTSDNSNDPKAESPEKGQRNTDNQMTMEEANAIRERDKERARIATEKGGVQPQTAGEVNKSQAIPLNYLEKYVGQYPSAFNFLGNTAIRSRMKELMGKEAFPEALDIWKEETPLEIQSGLIFTTAQKGPAENDPKLALMVDVGRDLLFVAVKNFETVGEQTFAERNADIPVRLKNWAEKK
ncbi:MAG: hypothetical protein DWQ02_14060 [Bacteroidetes bacterium]|nr:MAG: hypothetical protein DWQ02_14060 [Bacteroidota bacterium]